MGALTHWIHNMLGDEWSVVVLVIAIGVLALLKLTTPKDSQEE